MQAFKCGQQVCSRPIAREALILVARVDSVADARAVKRLTQTRAPLAQQRTHDASATLRNSRQPCETCAAGQVQEDRFGLVIGGVRGQDHGIRPSRYAHLLEEGVARHASRLLQPVAALSRQGRDIGPADGGLHAELGGGIGHESGIVGGAVS